MIITHGKSIKIIPLFFFIISMIFSTASFGNEKSVLLDSPMPPPAWAVMQRELLRENSKACELFYSRYFDERGYLQCVERWGGDDGPDDAMECCNDWPLLHALGGDNSVLELYQKAWEGHLRQFTEARTTHVPFAKNGMYYKEFPVMFDWLHNGEGLSVFNLKGLSTPDSSRFAKRVKRFAGFYMNEDPGALNYDPKHKIIRSMINGSRGPMLRKATALDWAGDPIDVKNRFLPRHGESSYKQMIEHFKDYNDVVGDHPSNLLATSLALNAYMLTHEKKYKKWLLEYVDAWVSRMKKNNGIIPSNIGLDGTIGGETDGKWYGGVYGWGFSVTVPQTGELAHRSTFQSGFYGFMNAFILTGDDRYLDPWRKQYEIVNSNFKMIDGKKMYPHKYGDKGWYDYSESQFLPFANLVYYLSQNPADLKNMKNRGLNNLSAEKSERLAIEQMQHDFEKIRSRLDGMEKDPTTPDTRLSDDPMIFNPCSVNSLIHFMNGGIHPAHVGAVFNCRVRYFDPVHRRAGIPEDVGALVYSIKKDEISVLLVNLNQRESREVVLQSGAYAEHEFLEMSVGNKRTKVNNSFINVKLSPGSGARLKLKMKRYQNQPVMQFPWNR